MQQARHIFRRADDEVAFARVRANACKIADGLAEIDRRNAPAAGLRDEVHACKRVLPAVRRVDIDCVRADDQISVYGGRNEDALAARRLRLPLGLAGHRADVAAPAAGAVDDDAGLVIAGFGMYEHMAALVLQTGDLASQPELNAVAHGGLRLCDAQPPRVDDRGARCVQRCDNVFRKVRLHLVRLLRVEDAQTRHAVADAVFEQVLKVLLLLLIERQNERADALVADRQVAAQLLHQLRAANVQLCHERAVLRVVACVNDGAVGLCRTHGNVVLALEHEHAQPVLRERIGKRCADHAAAHDGYIIHTFPSVFPTKKKPKQPLRSAFALRQRLTLTLISQANKLIHFCCFHYITGFA